MSAELLIPFGVAYLVGSVPFGLVIGLLLGKGDIRRVGSGNIGATNVLRAAGRGPAVATVLLDGGKGAVFAALPVLSLLGYWKGCQDLGLPSCEQDAELRWMIYRTAALLLGFAAVLGHIFPVWLGFRGGKGFATTLGVLLAAVPAAGAAAALAWICAAALFRISSVGALAALLVAPVAALGLYGPLPGAAALLLSTLVVYKHRGNIARLRAGTEPRIGQKKK